MAKTNIECSVVIVNYKVKDLLLKCIESIYHNNKTQNYEIIVVDNDDRKTVSEVLKKKFPRVVYIPNKNKGFGQANNVGTKRARGKYLFFLNPDTEVSKNTIPTLLKKFREYKKLAIVAPMLLDKDSLPYKLQGTTKLGVKEGLVALSFLNKLLPRNPISKKYWLLGRNRKKDLSVDVVPGTAFMIEKSLYEKLEGFDEQFFLYFEEYDLCRRARQLGYKIIITPYATVMHLWGESTKRSSLNTKKIYFESQFRYFKKHHGLLSALLVTAFTKLDYRHVAVTVIAIVGFLLRAYELSKGMIVIGDQGWYFLSARDILLRGDFPLVGIPSSHLWINQGAFWTYLLVPFLAIFNFNLLAVGYFAIIIDCITIITLFYFCSKFLSSRVGILAALIYAFSPLMVMLSRMPYHTSPIPLFTIAYLFFLVKWVKGNYRSFPVLLLLLATLYNFELATFVLAFPLAIFFTFGLFKKKQFVINLLNTKWLLVSIGGLVLPLVPFIIYDIGNNYSQTVMFIVFLAYKVAVKFGYPALTPQPNVDYGSLVAFFGQRIDELLLPAVPFLGRVLFLLSLLLLLVRIIYARALESSTSILLVVFGTAFLGFLVAGVRSDAYLPIFYPVVILIISLVLIMYVPLRILAVTTLLFITANFFIIIKYAQESNYYAKVLEASKEIVLKSDNMDYKIVGRGEGSEFQSYTDTYEYLTWWLGNGPVDTNVKRYFMIEDMGDTVEVNSVIIK